jgi:hypothetical protein
VTEDRITWQTTGGTWLAQLEPVSGRWSWMRVFGCCNLEVVEPDEDQQGGRSGAARRRLNGFR